MIALGFLLGVAAVVLPVLFIPPLRALVAGKLAKPEAPKSE